MKRLILFFLFVGMMASVANAVWYWEGDVSALWSVPSNWTDGTVSPPATVPHTATESMYIPKGTPALTADTSDTMGLLMVSRGGTGASSTLNLNNSDVTLTVSRDSGELVSVNYDGSSSGTINISAGKLYVTRSTATKTGEVRLSHVYDAACVSTINLSGTGTLDTDILNKGSTAATNANFNATGGTLVIRNNIQKWGLGVGFHQGGCTLEPEGVNIIGDMTTGNASNLMDYFMDDDALNSKVSKVMFDLGNGNADPLVSINDKINCFGDFTLNGDLLVNFMGTYAVGDKWNVLTIDSSRLALSSVIGAFDALPSNIQVNVLDTNTDSRFDTVQLEYVPEPATLALFGIGLIAIRRRK